MLRFVPMMLVGWMTVSSIAWAAETAAVIQNTMAIDADIRAAAIASLRLQGPDNLAALLAERDRIVAERAKLDPIQSQRMIATIAQRLPWLEQAIDEVANQRYACQSRLYWYTDLEQAKAVAAKERKPILSLRMLGKLNEDFSCANSRFFRTTLYANTEIAQLLRDKFVLHWKSVRPVPRVTIDFGDGRKLERTLTGNSIHYILLPDGQVVDALPGLYGPAAFTSHLNTCLALCNQLGALDATSRRERLVTFHESRLAELDRQWTEDYGRASALLASGESPTQTRAAPTPALQSRPIQSTAPTAAAAAQIAVPKRRIEMSLVRAAIPAVPQNPRDVTDERLWQLIAELHASEAKLDPASVALIRSQNPIAVHAARLAITKKVVEDPLVRLVRSLEGSIAVDTVRNEYQFHRQIHSWLVADASPNVETLNERVYAQLFLTPSSDPWLGLAPVDAYTALPNAGVTATREPR
jgi:hypothetical protein